MGYRAFLFKQLPQVSRKMSDFQSWDYGAFEFDLPDDEFLALIEAPEWDALIDIATCSNASIENDTQFLDTSDPISCEKELIALGVPKDITDAAYYSAGDVSGPNTTDSQSAEPLNSSGLSLSQNRELSASPVGPGGKNLEDCLFEFEGPKPSNTSKKRRKPFSNKRRREVGQVRRAGACIRCRITKTPVRVPDISFTLRG